jgi:uroporphyrinogen decarboxylase
VFSLPFLLQIAQRVKEGLGSDAVPMIVFARGAHYALEDLSKSEYDGMSLDWTVDPESARKRTLGNITLQGNADPCLLYGNKDTIREYVRNMLRGFGTKERLIANLGHGMYPGNSKFLKKDHDPEHLRMYLEAIRDISLEMNKD